MTILGLIGIVAGATLTLMLVMSVVFAYLDGKFRRSGAGR